MVDKKETTEITLDNLKSAVLEIFTAGGSYTVVAEAMHTRLAILGIKYSDERLELALTELVADGLLLRKVSYSYSGAPTTVFHYVPPVAQSTGDMEQNPDHDHTCGQDHSLCHGLPGRG